ncbi:hypothetical protein A2415_02105 [candidate division WWE3 bacterium RIFOXYC1_FULL_39_7]|uniref:Peptidase C39-like domain-containing protein n=2 Tax=Katanobacteria TaxID=422282 RepID=A0A1F4X8V3_UNCKA|nr:MAG: hypothetical protein A2415_02105 [candidate division WWE3 bacterium RIFOXYC1_FULL_39_7]OGC78106.1 MAG: hypothetical protein A2619_05125 [candidate division WWE3 bacterium RIFOXYD1_FULL_39_9]
MYSRMILSFLIATTMTIPNTEAPQNTAGATPEIRHFINTDKTVLLDVPYVNQVDNLPEDKKTEIRASACGPTAVTMALNYLGDERDLYSVIEKLPTSVYVRGQMFYNLYDAAKYFDKETVKIKRDAKTIFETLKDGHPIIMNIQNYNGFIGHAIVVVGIKNFDGIKADALIAHDPFTKGYREFKYINERTLQQPEGHYNYIGILDPFYIVDPDDSNNDRI